MFAICNTWRRGAAAEQLGGEPRPGPRQHTRTCCTCHMQRQDTTLLSVRLSLALRRFTTLRGVPLHGHRRRREVLSPSGLCARTVLGMSFVESSRSFWTTPAAPTSATRRNLLGTNTIGITDTRTAVYESRSKFDMALSKLAQLCKVCLSETMSDSSQLSCCLSVLAVSTCSQCHASKSQVVPINQA